MFGFFFTDQTEVNSFDAVMACNADHFKAFFLGMLNEGVYLAPSAFEASFVSAALSDDDIEHTLRAAEKVMKTL